MGLQNIPESKHGGKMATALEEKIENLGTKLTRLAAENKKIIKERERKCQPSLDLGFPSRDSGFTYSGNNVPPPRTGRPKLKNLNFIREKRKSERSAAIEWQLKELTKKAAILAIDGETFPF